MSHRAVKIVLSLFLLTAGLLALTGALDHRAGAYINVSFTRALVAFGIARGLNGVISVAQGTEVALQPAGVGFTFTPGEILDPINDLVERFSWIMLASNASLGIQKILLEMSSWPWFSIPAALFLAFAAAALWIPSLQKPGWMRFWTKTALILILIRFSVPIGAVASELVYRQFLTPQYKESSEELKKTTEELMRLNRSGGEDLPKSGDASFLENAKGLYQKALSALDIEVRIERYKQAASDAARHTINLIVVFIVQTILFPLAFLAGIVLLGKSLLRVPLFVFSSPGGHRARGLKRAKTPIFCPGPRLGRRPEIFLRILCDPAALCVFVFPPYPGAWSITPGLPVTPIFFGLKPPFQLFRGWPILKYALHSRSLC